MTKLKKLRHSAISVAALSSSLMVVTGPVANASEVQVSTQGIVGTGIGGGSSTQGIVGTGIGGGSSTQGIVGTGIRGKLELAALNAGVVDSGLPIVAYGPVEQVVDGGYLILGQLVTTVDQASRVNLNVGDTAIVFGFVSDDGIVTDRIVKSRDLLVQGSSPVFIAGIVDESDPTQGFYNIGALKVEIGSAGTSPSSFTVQPGQYVEVIGVEFNGLLVAENIEADTF